MLGGLTLYIVKAMTKEDRKSLIHKSDELCALEDYDYCSAIAAPFLTLLPSTYRSRRPLSETWDCSTPGELAYFGTPNFPCIHATRRDFIKYGLEDYFAQLMEYGWKSIYIFADETMYNFYLMNHDELRIDVLINLGKAQCNMVGLSLWYSEFRKQFKKPISGHAVWMYVASMLIGNDDWKRYMLRDGHSTMFISVEKLISGRKTIAIRCGDLRFTRDGVITPQDFAKLRKKTLPVTRTEEIVWQYHSAEDNINSGEFISTLGPFIERLRCGEHEGIISAYGFDDWGIPLHPSLDD
jgi:hypothetical protein